MFKCFFNRTTTDRNCKPTP